MTAFGKNVLVVLPRETDPMDGFLLICLAVWEPAPAVELRSACDCEPPGAASRDRISLRVADRSADTLDVESNVVPGPFRPPRRSVCDIARRVSKGGEGRRWMERRSDGVDPITTSHTGALYSSAELNNDMHSEFSSR